MKKNNFRDIPVLDPEIAARDKIFYSKGFQYYRDRILSTLSNLSFSEKFKIIKKVDRDLLQRFNTFQGTKAVHTLDYISKMPSRKKDLTKTEEIILLLRSISIFYEKKNFYNERRKIMIKILK